MLYCGDAEHLPYPDKSVDLVFGSPPYTDARKLAGMTVYKCEQWIEWMLRVTKEACRVSRGLVVWVVAGNSRKWKYQPAPEGLLYRWYAQGGVAWCPAYWYASARNIGSGGPQWLRRDVEYCLAFTDKQGPIPFADNKANGAPCVYKPGGEFSNREQSGKRTNEGKKGKKAYTPPKIANPGNLLHINVGGGHLGSELAHKNEAPFPESLADFFIKHLVPPNGVVCDPFVGSGTTIISALKNGRRAIGVDIRQSQIDLCQERLAKYGT